MFLWKTSVLGFPYPSTQENYQTSRTGQAVSFQRDSFGFVKKAFHWCFFVNHMEENGIGKLC